MSQFGNIEDESSTFAAAAAQDAASVAVAMPDGDGVDDDHHHHDLMSSSPLYQADPSFSSDYYESLDLSFDDIAADSGKGDQLLYPTCKKSASASSTCAIDDTNTSYILGTLIVRVVAARNLSSVDSPGLAQAMGGILFGGGGGSRRGGNLRSNASANVNPYASVRFGSTTQRTSQVFGTVDPIWPRTEAMYLDVTHPPPQSLEEPVPTSNGNSSGRRSFDSSDRSSSVADTTKEALGKWRIDPPLLTVGVFHSTSDMSLKKQKYTSGDSNDVFLGMATVNLTYLLTGKCRFDEWLPLAGGSKDNQNASVRLVCEYEPSDPPPHKGDVVEFTRFCRPADLYPLSPFGNKFTVEEGCNDHDLVLISHTSREGWVSTFLAHRFMLLVVERHLGAMDIYQEEMLSIAQRLSHSPMVNVVQDSCQRLEDEGLIHLGAAAVQGGMGLLNRWFRGGVETVVQDLAYATNWDGRFNPDAETSLATNDDPSSPTAAGAAASSATVSLSSSTPELDDEESRDDSKPALPNMPSCPITQEPMRDPVVAADGHTYERSAIVRWLQTSDKSPLTGSILPHKNLVPNYMLLSSLQEQASVAAAAAASPVSSKPPPIVVETVTEESDLEDETTDVLID